MRGKEGEKVRGRESETERDRERERGGCWADVAKVTARGLS